MSEAAIPESSGATRIKSKITELSADKIPAVAEVDDHGKRVRGAAPKFIQGLQDVELHEGEMAAVAGRTYRRKKRSHAKEFPVTAEAVQQKTTKTIEEIRHIIESRNRSLCQPKFIVRPRSKKQIEEGKSLRLKTAISANPGCFISWDKNGIVLETGNKYSMHNDGDFYYLEIHRVNDTDSAFYNCTATNSLGIATASSEVEVL
uniref:Ig-like domain-containing protein n=1 Tax=Romanomermis culicivorax TaxID=13658 RepID=A0A915JHK1_ROMCU